MNPTPPETLSREQLLAALDTEITNFQATKASTGRTRWALTLSLSGLLWLGIQTWEAAKFDPRNVALLAIALTVLWGFILKVSGSLDSSLLPHRPMRGRLFAFSHLLGALRSTIFFYAIKQIAILAPILWLALPELVILKWCFVINLAGVVIIFIISYLDLPPIPALDAPKPFRVIVTTLDWVAWLVRLAVAGSAGYVLYKFASAFSAADLRLGVIIAAFGYLLTLLVEEQFPVSHLAALRAVRQHLAFARISTDEAQNQIDLLLLTGGSVANTVQHTPDSILAAAEQIRSNYAQVEGLLPNLQTLSAEISQGAESSDATQTKWTEYDRLHKFMVQLHVQAVAQHNRLLKRVKKFEEHVQFVANFSASSAKEAEPLIEKMKAALIPLAEQRAKLQPVLSPARLAIQTAPQPLLPPAASAGS